MVTCTFEDGSPSALRHLTLTAIIVKENKLLLAKRALHLHEGGKWCLPGGYMDRDETAPAGVRREVREETGYDCKILSLLRIIDAPNRPREDRQNVELTFVAEPLEKIADSDTETTEIKWFPLTEIPSEQEIAFDHWETIQMYLQQQGGKAISLLQSLKQA